MAWHRVAVGRAACTGSSSRAARQALGHHSWRCTQPPASHPVPGHLRLTASSAGRAAQPSWLPPVVSRVRERRARSHPPRRAAPTGCSPCGSTACGGCTSGCLQPVVYCGNVGRLSQWQGATSALPVTLPCMTRFSKQVCIQLQPSIFAVLQHRRQWGRKLGWHSRHWIVTERRRPGTPRQPRSRLQGCVTDMSS